MSLRHPVASLGPVCMYRLLEVKRKRQRDIFELNSTLNPN